MKSLAIDHRAGFLLACVDGVSTVEELVDIAGMDQKTALELLTSLRDLGAITIG